MIWEEMRAGDFEEAVKRSGGVCVIPFGATEKHGQHLPLGTDNMIGRHVIQDAAEIADVMAFSTFEFGELLGFQHHPGSICLSINLIIDYMTELCAEIARNGFKKVVILSSHGGNMQIKDVIAQKSQESKKDYVILSGISYNPEPFEILDYIKEKGREAFPYITDEDVATLESFCSEKREVGHACFGETLAVLGCRPDTVDLSLVQAESGESTHRFDDLRKFKKLYSPYFWAGRFPNHYQGTYHPGMNENLGRISHELQVQNTAKLLLAIKEDDDLLRINEEWNKMW